MENFHRILLMFNTYWSHKILNLKGIWGWIKKTLRSLVGPKYDGKYLHQLVRKKLGETRLYQTLTNVVIPTFDIKRLQPTIFSTYEDICIGSSAAPTYLPAHYFNNQDNKGNAREFNLIDGGVTANNPNLAAIGQVTKEIFHQNPDFFPIKPMDYGCFLVISLGTGSPKIGQKYNAKMAAKWGILNWLLHGGSTPLVDVFSQSSVDMVDFHLSVLFQALHSEANYLKNRMLRNKQEANHLESDVDVEEKLERTEKKEKRREIIDWNELERTEKLWKLTRD
uniref:Lipolytic acyl hydrolase (LAH) n=1 Tax=Paeonia suffruticosa TaxID=45171 RepID=A0AB38Z7G8_PAESU